MAKAKMKKWLVTLVPPKGGKQKLATRPGDIGSTRTQLRNYYLEAATRSEAQSIIEEHERTLSMQQDTDPWVIDTVKAA